jgi:hypothetical protein
MPFHDYENFNACVLDMTKKGHSEESARKICGAMERDAKMQMADFNSNWVEIFRAGDYGDKGKWTESEIDKVVANFAAGVWKPPAVVGHPETNSPAMGWVKELQRQGKTLVAKFDQVQPELEALVTNGRYPNRSAAFYTDPQGKGPVLRHVGFLGGTPPEVKGLAPIKFSSTDFTEIELKEEEMDDKKGIMEAVREFFAETFGKKQEHAGFSEEQLTTAIAKATAPLVEQNKQLAEQNKAFATQFTELNNKLAATSNSALQAKAIAFVEKLKGSGKWIPAFDAAGMTAMLEHLAVSGGTVKFGEAGKEKEFSSYDALCSFLEQLPAIVPTGKITTVIKTPSGQTVKFNEARGIGIDVESIALNEKALKIQQERKCEFGEALRIAAEEMGF